MTILLADIGGTNARFALWDESTGLNHLQIFKTADHPNFNDAVAAYVASCAAQAKIDRAVIAVATAVTGDLIEFANSPWRFSRAAIAAQFGWNQLHVMNDFKAVALSVPHVPRDQLQSIGGGQPQPDQPIGVIGPGTGLGVGYLLPDGRGGWIANSGEGGHVTATPNTPREWAVIEYLLTHKYQSHVSAERLVSGKGIENMYQAICAMDGYTPDAAIDAAQISRRGISGQCPICAEVMQIFCAMLGSVAGNLALTLGAHGGVYIAGGIPVKILDYFKTSEFRARFEAKGRRREYMQSIPTYVITANNFAFLGLAAYGKSNLSR